MEDIGDYPMEDNGATGEEAAAVSREKTGGALGWGSGTRHRERAPFIFSLLLCSGPTLL